jgi:molybdate transport system substrate-binding protein
MSPAPRLACNWKAFVVVCVMAIALTARADEVRVAVATNFAEVVEKIKPGFEKRTGHRLLLVSGSTGKLYAQIKNGAPLDVFLSADAQTPQRLVAQGDAVADSRFTYALGRLVLWSATPTAVGADGAATLQAATFRHLAIANPQLAPYGMAAIEVLRELKIWDVLQPKLVYAQNIGHTFSMVASGNAELGLIAASSLAGAGSAVKGSSWLVPANLHAPIRQDVVLLQRGRNNAGARAFLAELKTPDVRKTIESFGYISE